jgi:hypothetical protein
MAISMTRAAAGGSPISTERQPSIASRRFAIKSAIVDPEKGLQFTFEGDEVEQRTATLQLDE